MHRNTRFLQYFGKLKNAFCYKRIWKHTCACARVHHVQILTFNHIKYKINILSLQQRFFSVLLDSGRLGFRPTAFIGIIPNT
jgi:hypothetical protein